MTQTSSRPAPTGHVWRGLLLVSGAGVVWGTIGPAVQLVHDGSGLSPLTIGAYRAVAAVGALVVASLVASRVESLRRLVRGHAWRVVVTGVATALFQLLFFVAVIEAGVSVGTVVSLGFAPVLLLVAGSIQRRRAPSPLKVLTVAVALLGLLLVSLVGGAGDHPGNVPLGIVAALGSGAAYAVSTDVGAPLSRTHDALTVTTATMSVAAVVLVPGGLLAAYARGEDMSTTHLGSWLLLGYLGVVTMAFAYVLLFAGLRSTTSGAAVVATLLEPVTAVLIAVLLLGERLTVAGVAGAFLILLAIATSGRRSPEPPSPQ